jgi:hypothetical protein
VEPKGAHDPSRYPVRTGPQHKLPEPDAAARIVDIHRTLYLRAWSDPEGVSAINTPCCSVIVQEPYFVEVDLIRL